MVNRTTLGLMLVLSGMPFAGGARAAVEYLGPPGMLPGAGAAYPRPLRPVAPIVSDRWRAEDERQRVGEAQRVADWLEIRPGMVVADIGAGSGYYTAWLSARVGPEGRVLAQDVVPDYLARLQQRVVRERLSNVTVGLGEPGDPRLPAGSIDAAVLIHMYHEIEQPFALLTNLAPALRAGGRVGIVDVDDATERHGTPRALLQCELASVGYREVGFHWLLVQPPRSEYLAVFEAPAVPVGPGEVRACSLGG